MGLLHRPSNPIEESQLEEGYLALINLPSKPSFAPIFTAKKLHKLQVALEDALNQVAHGDSIL